MQAITTSAARRVHRRPRAGAGRHVQQQRAGAIFEAHPFGRARHDALDERGQRFRQAVIVAHEHLGVGRGRADHVEAAQIAQRQNRVVVLEQHHGFERGFIGKLAMRVAVDDAFGDSGVGHLLLRVEHAQLEARGVDARHGAVDVALAR